MCRLQQTFFFLRFFFVVASLLLLRCIAFYLLLSVNNRCIIGNKLAGFGAIIQRRSPTTVVLQAHAVNRSTTHPQAGWLVVAKARLKSALSMVAADELQNMSSEMNASSAGHF